MSSLPATAPLRNQWVTDLRGPKNALDPFTPYVFLNEQEPDARGAIVNVATIFLTNRECPWKCVMCDLWRNTLDETVPPGAIPAQIDHALARLPAGATHVKLYNSGSFFDARAIPLTDDEVIALRVAGFDRVIVECHPALVAERCLAFARRLRGELEVAMGLETAHPESLERLNKGMTLEQFASAARTLRENGIALRAFVLVRPPFVPPDDADEWVRRSIDFAFDQDATAVSLIPTRAGNGAMDELAGNGEFAEPALAELERAADYGVGLGRGRVFADLWDVQRFSACPYCFEARRARLTEQNLRQRVAPRVACDHCGAMP